MKLSPGCKHQIFISEKNKIFQASHHELTLLPLAGNRYFSHFICILFFVPIFQAMSLWSVPDSYWGSEFYHRYHENRWKNEWFLSRLRKRKCWLMFLLLSFETSNFNLVKRFTKKKFEREAREKNEANNNTSVTLLAGVVWSLIFSKLNSFVT